MNLSLLKTTFFSFILLTSSFAKAQEGEFRVISTTGENYHEFGTPVQKVRLVPGAKVKPEGKLLVKENNKVKLICKDQPIVFSKAGTYDLKECFKKNAKRSMSYTSKFWDFVMSGLKKSDSKEDIKEYHQQYMSVTGGVKGYSAEGLKILNLFPGKIVSNAFVIDIQDDQNNAIYDLTIFDASNRSKLKQISFKGMSYAFNENDFEMERDKSYVIQIASRNHRYELQVEFVNLDNDKIERRLNSIQDFQNSTKNEKLWMRAIVLEMEDYHQEAYTQYRWLLENNPNDEFINKNYKLFLARQNQLEQ